MSFDPHPNLLQLTITTTPASPTTQTSLEISNADRDALVAVVANPTTTPLNGALGPATSRTPSNTEIVRITAVGADDSSRAGYATLTVTRNAETGGQTGHSVAANDVIKIVPTKKTFTDIEANADPSGWIAISVSLTYSSADGHIFVVTTGSDLSGIIGVGDRVKFTNNSTTFYGIVHAISSTTITLYGGTQYTVANSAITNPYYSHEKVPYGFNPREDYWTEEVSNATQAYQSSAVQNTWYNISSISIAIPIGVWRINYQCFLMSNGSATQTNAFATLSTTNNSETDGDFTVGFDSNGPTGMANMINREKILALAAKTTYYLNLKTSATGNTYLQTRGDLSKTFIRARSAYL